MSGIVAMVWADPGLPELDVLEKLTAAQSYRGPNRQRTWFDAHAGLGHALLKTDEPPEEEVQPLTLDGQLWITADARIDGRDVLAATLTRFGSPATRNTQDAQLIALAHRVFGCDCPRHLAGDFSFAIWDAETKRLTAAVDRFAIRPLYYAWIGRAFVVSSCLASIRLHPAFHADLDELALGDFLLFGHYREAEATIFAGARRLPPGHMLLLDEGRLTIRRYWSPTLGTISLPRDKREVVEQFKGVLESAVADRMTEGRAVMLMSGGLDSAVIAASARKPTQPGSVPLELRAHTAIYERLIPDDEQAFAAQTARALDIPITFHPTDDFEIFDWIDRLGWIPPEPLELPGLGASIDFHRRLSAEGPIVLTGNDGDTLLRASTPAHFRSLLQARDCVGLIRDAAWYTYRRRQVPLLRLYRRWRAGGTSAPAMPEWLRPDWVKRIGLLERWRELNNSPAGSGPRNRVPAALVAAYYSRVFDLFDPAWSSLPLEFRHPLMDVRVVDFLLSLPTVPWCVDKELFRRVLVGSVPEAVRRRPKTPLRVDPLVRQVFGRQEGWLTKPTLDPALDRFIDRSKLPLPSGGQSADEIWSLLRPIALDFWWRRGKY